MEVEEREEANKSNQNVLPAFMTLALNNFPENIRRGLDSGLRLPENLIQLSRFNYLTKFYLQREKNVLEQ